MIEGRGGNFDSSGERCFAIRGNHTAQNFQLLARHEGLVGRAEIPPLGDQPADFGVAGEKFLIEPGDLGKHLQVAIILRGKSPAGLGHIGVRLACVVKLAEARVPADHALRIGVEKVFQNQRLIRFRQVLGGFDGGFQKRVHRSAGGVFRHLHQHGRNQIESLPHRGKLLQQAHHAVIVFQRVQAGPWQLVAAGNQIFVKRLVHVPEKAQVDPRHPGYRAK